MSHKALSQGNIEYYEYICLSMVINVIEDQASTSVNSARSIMYTVCTLYSLHLGQAVLNVWYPYFEYYLFKRTLSFFQDYTAIA